MKMTYHKFPKVYEWLKRESDVAVEYSLKNHVPKSGLCIQNFVSYAHDSFSGVATLQTSA